MTLSPRPPAAPFPPCAEFERPTQRPSARDPSRAPLPRGAACDADPPRERAADPPDPNPAGAGSPRVPAQRLPTDTWSSRPAASAVTLFVCTTCRGPDGAESPPTDGERLLAAVRDAAAGTAIRVAGAACLANCDRRLSAAFVADGGWTYAFGGLVPADAQALVEGARLLDAAAGAMLPWRGRPDCLKRGMIARVPPTSRAEEAR